MGATIDERVAELRGFNRFYTGVIGVLQEGLLETPYSLTEARVLFELGSARSVEVGELKRSLELDGGYLSRILARFEADGLVRVERSNADARRKVIALTPPGRRAYRLLDSRSARETRALLSRLVPGEQARLIDAVRSLRVLLADPSAPREVTLREPGPGDLGWVVARHGAIYADEYDWDTTFEGLVASIVGEFAREHDPATERAWIAEVDGARAGCVFCVRRDEETAQLRLLLVDPAARGLGLGGRLVDECIAFARAAGHRRMVLWTNDVLVAARRLYEQRGFELVDEGTHHSFGHDLVEQTWSLTLAA